VKRLLLDTRTFLWWLADDPRLGTGARSAIALPANQVFVSAVTGWEIAIKRALGKLEAPDGLEEAIEQEGFLHLPVSFRHGERAGALPLHHRDPFDRMLIAQCELEGLELVSADLVIAKYSVSRLPADV
jgi:PIN domain nuclease of toxin-antitoxin system